MTYNFTIQSRASKFINICHISSFITANVILTNMENTSYVENKKNVG